MSSGQNGKEALRLTRKEQQLLALLEGSPGRCFSRPYLLKALWGYSDKTKTRTIDVHVSRLRKKLQGRRNVAIHTVVRQGYVLEQHGEAGGLQQRDAKVPDPSQTQNVAARAWLRDR